MIQTTAERKQQILPYKIYMAENEATNEWLCLKMFRQNFREPEQQLTVNEIF